MRPHTLFLRTAAILAATLLVFQLAALGALAYYAIVPLGRQATGDLAALMILSAKTWVELPPETHADFARELLEQHALTIAPAAEPPPETASYLPYRLLLEQALSRRMGQDITVRVAADPERYWADIPVAGQTLRVGFSRNRIAVRPPFALGSISVALLLLAAMTAFLLARTLTRPLAGLVRAAGVVGQGGIPEPLPESGPAEIAALARAFNRMARDVQELADNRTTMLTGISHDLRTPLARLRLAVEMLSPNADPALVAGIERDIAVMDRLIGQYLDLARDLNAETPERLDLRELVDQAVSDARRAGANVSWQPPPQPCPASVRESALQRVLGNLLDNARRYGGGAPIDVTCEHDGSKLVIAILDRGRGIPVSERTAVFRPFYRVESSRSGATGGTGLGLAVARQLSEWNGWKIVLAPREGGGTAARLTISM